MAPSTYHGCQHQPEWNLCSPVPRSLMQSEATPNHRNVTKNVSQVKWWETIDSMSARTSILRNKYYNDLYIHIYIGVIQYGGNPENHWVNPEGPIPLIAFLDILGVLKRIPGQPQSNTILSKWFLVASSDVISLGMSACLIIWRGKSPLFRCALASRGCLWRMRMVHSLVNKTSCNGYEILTGCCPHSPVG